MRAMRSLAVRRRSLVTVVSLTIEFPLAGVVKGVAEEDPRAHWATGQVSGHQLQCRALSMRGEEEIS